MNFFAMGCFNRPKGGGMLPQLGSLAGLHPWALPVWGIFRATRSPHGSSPTP